MAFFAVIGEVLFILFGVWLCLTGVIVSLLEEGRLNIESIVFVMLGLVVIYLSLHFGVISIGVGG